MTRAPRLDEYHFYEQDWDSYEQLCDEFEWRVPDTFNLADYVCDRWVGERRTAIIIDDGPDQYTEYTYEEIDRASNALANLLHERGIRKGDRVGVNLPHRVETVVAHVAAWKLAAVSVPLSTLFGTDALQYRLTDCGVKALIVDEANVGNVREVEPDVESLETLLTIKPVESRDDELPFWPTIGDYSQRFDNRETNPDDSASIFYTSGTTGDPKGVVHGHRVILGELPLFLLWFMDLEMNEDAVFWTPGDWAWMGGLFNIVVPGMFYGLPSAGWTRQFDPEAAFELIDRHGITNCWIPPTALRMMQQPADVQDRFDVSSVEVIASGGEALGESIIDWAATVFEDVAVHEGYGQTEANMVVGTATAMMEQRPGKMGKRAPGHEVRIVDPETAEQTVQAGEVGEIAVKYGGDPVCFKKYWNKPKKTAKKIENGWLLTGDLGSVDEDGYYSFVSRKDDVIISAGYRIGPEEIEDALAGHDAVADAGVIGVPDESRGEIPKAYVVLSNDIDDDASFKEELQTYVKSTLAKYEYPREIEIIDELPTTTTGKIRRKDLREQY